MRSQVFFILLVGVFTVRSFGLMREVEVNGHEVKFEKYGYEICSKCESLRKVELKERVNLRKSPWRRSILPPKTGKWSYETKKGDWANCSHIWGDFSSPGSQLFGEGGTSPVGMDARTKTQEHISQEKLLSILQDNESHIKTFMGDAKHTELKLIQQDEGKYIKPEKNPLVIQTVHSSVIYDGTKGVDYKMDMRHESDILSFKTPFRTEKRVDNIVRTLFSDPNKVPKAGKIRPPVNSSGLDHFPRNITCSTNIFKLTTQEKDGFRSRPLSEALSESVEVYIDEEEHEIGSNKCMKIAVIHPYSEKGCEIVFAWLGKDINYHIVKQQTLVVSIKPSEAEDYFEKTTFAELLEWAATQRPNSLMICDDYQKVEVDYWVPRIMKSYCTHRLKMKNVANEAVFNEIQMHTKHNPDTSMLDNTIVSTCHTWELDMSSLKINEVIDRQIFEESIFPEGIPVSDFVSDIDSKGPKKR